MDVTPDRAPHPLAAWLAATQGETTGAPAPDEASTDSTRSARPTRLLIAAAVPWVIVVGVGWAALTRTPPASPVAAVAASTAPTPTAPASTSGGPADAGVSPVLDQRLAAAAVLTVRLAAPDGQYIDTAVAEQAHSVAGATVVTVATAVLDRVGAQWTGPRHVRFAVPFAVDQSEPVALSAPWVLPSTDPARATPPAKPVDDAALAAAAVDALGAAGYRGIAAPQLRRHPALPDIVAVHVSARAPGERTARDHEIWLDSAASRVLGGPDPAPAPLPAPVPAEAP
jgi:hypothetical protein